MKHKIFCIMSLLLLLGQTAWAWDGEGTVTSPYLIKTTADWKQLADDVYGGTNYSGYFFEMTADIDANGVSVGSESRPFSGTFSGANHTLTFNRGEQTAEHTVVVGDNCSPFLRLDGATIHHLHVTGTVCSSYQHTGGIVSHIRGNKMTTISDCQVSSNLWAGSNLSNDASFGGFVGIVDDDCEVGPAIRNCIFSGRITGWPTFSGGFVGFTHKPVTFAYCIFDPTELPSSDGCATYARTVTNVECTFEECYYTKTMGTIQGRGMFTNVIVPEGCTATILGEPKKKYNGKDYYTSGAKVELTVPEGTQFDHWVATGMFLGDPWTAGGVHTVSDVRYQPELSIATSMPAPVQDNRSRDGITYRYLSNRDYHLFMSDSLREARGYRFDDDGECFVYDKDGTRNWVGGMELRCQCR